MSALGFDPMQPAARRLARNFGPLREQNTVRLTAYLVDDEHKLLKPGELLTLPRPLADELVARAGAERLP